MKFISLFGRTPSHKRFSYEPRFYNAQSEARKEREDRIRRELELEQGNTSSSYRDRISGAFHLARKRSKQTSGQASATVLRSALLLFLTLFAIAWLQWGSVVVYSLLLFAPLYFYLKIRRT